VAVCYERCTPVGFGTYPAVHSTHALALPLSMYAPAAHRKHKLWLPSEKLPAAQRSHDVAPGSADIDPGGQSVQTPEALREKEPGLGFGVHGLGFRV